MGSNGPVYPDEPRSSGRSRGPGHGFDSSRQPPQGLAVKKDVGTRSPRANAARKAAFLFSDNRPPISDIRLTGNGSSDHRTAPTKSRAKENNKGPGGDPSLLFTAALRPNSAQQQELAGLDEVTGPHPVEIHARWEVGGVECDFVIARFDLAVHQIGNLLAEYVEDAQGDV